MPAGSAAFAFAPWAAPRAATDASADASAAEAATAAAWAARFPGEPFHLAPPEAAAADTKLTAATAASAALSYDIAAAAQRQRDFLWQVAPPQYEHAAFLADGARRYAQLLALMGTHPKVFLVPSYDMDLLWHAHMAWPAAYARDTAALCGFVAPHDDGVNDRAAGGKLAGGAAATAAAWREAYPGEEWAKRGAMWLGAPPAWYHAAEPRWRGGMPCEEGLAPPPPGYGAPPPGQYMPPAGSLPGLTPLPSAEAQQQGGYPPQQQYAPQPQYGAPAPYGGGYAPQQPQYAPPPPGYAPQPQYAPQQPQYAQQQQPQPHHQVTMVTEESGCCCCPTTTTRPVATMNPAYNNGGAMMYGQPQPMMYGNRGMQGGMYGQQGGMMGGNQGGGMSPGMGMGIGIMGGALMGAWGAKLRADVFVLRLRWVLADARCACCAGMAVADMMDNDGGGCGGGGCGGGGE